MEASEPRAAARTPLTVDERRRWLVGLLLLTLAAIAVRWPAVEIGQLSDDYMQYAMIEGLYPGESYAPFDLYAFVRRGDAIASHVEQGTVPWFSEPNFHGAVFRPLSSLLLWLDHTLAPGAVKLWHVHSLLWFGASIFSFGLCARRLLATWPALVVVGLYACEAAFVSPLGWLANRCVLICAAFGFAAIWVHIERRDPDPDTPQWLRTHGASIELVLVLLAAAGGEYGLGIIGYIAAWELLAARDERGQSESWSTRAKALLPALIATLIYAIAHKGLGYGTFGAEVYADPVNMPLGWWKWAKLRIPKLAAGALWAVPSATIHVFRHPAAAWWYERYPSESAIELHESHAIFGLLGVGLAGLALGLARFGLRADERRVLRMMILAGVATLIPISAAPAHSRLLVITTLASCTLVALILVGCTRLLAAQVALAPAKRWALGLAAVPFAAAMLWLNTVSDLRWTHRYLVHLDAMQAANAAAFTEGDLLDQDLDGREVIVFNGPSQSVGMYGPFVLHAYGREQIPKSWRSLALGADHAMWVFRPEDKVLEIAAIRGAWLRTAGELFFRRASEPLAMGARFDYPNLQIEVQLDEDGDPTRVRFTFPHSLDDPRYLFLVSTKGGLERWEVIPIEASTVITRPRLPYVGNRDVLFDEASRSQGPK